LWKRLLIRQNVLGCFATSLKEETLEDGSTRTVKITFCGSAHKAAVLPLVKKKDGRK
jgi:glycyl-tRNA synthetase